MIYDPVEAIQDTEALIDELEEDVACLQGQISTLSNVLRANFGDEIGSGDDPYGKIAVEVAVRLLSELKARRQQVRRLSSELAEHV